jgi:predicted HicB family RNase H-like nuclease
MSMSHRGYTGSVEYSAPDRVFHGKLNGIRDIITYEGTTVDELETSFRETVDDYLAYCAEEGMEPQRPYSGRFVLRLSSEMHGEISAASRMAKESMNTWVQGAIEARLAEWRATLVNPAAAERPEYAPVD